MADEIWTIGHSTRTIDDFLDLLEANSIATLADVRKMPGSTRYPHFNREALESSLGRAGIAYRHVPELGGRRSKRLQESPNGAWRVDAFNAFADYMSTGEFESALDTLMKGAREAKTAIMCSEAVPWRCHRRLIADALTVRGWIVRDIVGSGRAGSHVLTPFARVDGFRITYPAEPLFPASNP